MYFKCTCSKVYECDSMVAQFQNPDTMIQHSYERSEGNVEREGTECAQ